MRVYELMSEEQLASRLREQDRRKAELPSDTVPLILGFFGASGLGLGETAGKGSGERPGDRPGWVGGASQQA